MRVLENLPWPAFGKLRINENTWLYHISKWEPLKVISKGMI